MIVGSIKRGALATVVVVVLPLLVGAASAFAEGEMPWWHVNGTAAPSELLAGGYGQVFVIASNLGDGEANGSGTPIVLADKLPAGIVPVKVSGGVGPLGLFGGGECSLETVSCTFHGGVAPYLSALMTITVKVEASAASGGLNEAIAEGGGAPRAVSRTPLSVGGSPTPFGVQAYELTPESIGGGLDTQAGSHPFQLTTTLDLNETVVSGGEKVVVLGKDLHFRLPPGLVGNPTAIPQCTTGEFSGHPPGAGVLGANLCPPNTVIGVAQVKLIIEYFGATPITVPVPLFNLVPQVGEPARFGFTVAGTPVLLDTSVRTGGDYGVVVDVRNISQTVEFMGSQVTFWGVPGDPRHNQSRGWNCVFFGNAGTGPCSPLGESSTPPFLVLPTSCATPWATTLTADSWAQPSVGKSMEYNLQDGFGHALGLSGCNRLTFEPSISLTPDGQAASTPTGLTVGIHVPQDATLNPTGVAEAAVKDTTVALPAGVTINPAGADGLHACSLSEVALESPAEQTCPEAAKIGTLEIHTPLLPNPLVGAAYLAQQNANPFGSLVAMYLVAHDPVSGVIVKLSGEVKPDPVTGQLVSTFKETPQLPFEDLRLHFFGGSRAPLGTPALCGSYTTTASIAPWSGNPPVDSSSQFQITSGPNGSPCSNPLPFAPSLTTGSLNIQAGAFTPFTMTMSREDGNQNLDAIQLKMPPGLLGTLSSVKLCGEAEGNAGTCGPDSLIGHTTVSVGLGGNPFTVTGGQVFITGPYEGAPYGLSIVNPAKAGPFDLGKVVVRAKIEVDPSNAALTITSDATGPYAIPQIIDGIPLQIKHVNVSIDRPNFTFNPTNCAPTQIGGSLTSSQGAISALHVPFQVTNCATLAFKPIFSVSTAGKTSRANGASLNVKLTYPKAPFGTQANIGKVKVDLPKQLPSRLTTLQKACPDSVFNANPAACPGASRIGSATATTPVLPVHLEGPAFFVSHGGAKFPELIVALSGEGVTVYLRGETFISPAGITSSTFRTIPDVPIGTFELKLPQGANSALAANGNLCTSKLVMPTTFVGANGMSIKQSTPITATGCPKHKKAKKTSKHKKKK
jgi:hypothetical protein